MGLMEVLVVSNTPGLNEALQGYDGLLVSQFPSPARVRSILASDQPPAAVYLEDTRGTISELMQARQWEQARTAYEQLLLDLGVAAAAMPVGGWEPIDARIKQGIAQEQDAEAATIEARTALGQGHANAAVDLLRRFVVADLPVHVALPLLLVREAAAVGVFVFTLIDGVP